MSQEKVPTLENSLRKEYLQDLKDSNSSYSPKDQRIFVILLAVSRALEP